MKRRKVNKYAIQYAVLFSAFSLALHFITVYLLCHGTGLLLAGGDMLNSPGKVGDEGESGDDHGTGRYVRESVHRFLLSVCHYNRNFSYNHEITAIEYVAAVLLFCLIQFGIFILERLINTHGMTELCNWLWAVLHQKAVWILLTLPLLISAGRYIIRMAGQKKE